MQKKWDVEPVNLIAEQEITELPHDLQAQFLPISDLLIAFEPQNIREPHIKHIKGKMWEMRLKGKDCIGRSIYLLSREKKIVILHSFIKKTQKTPRKALQIAEQRMKEASHDRI